MITSNKINKYVYIIYLEFLEFSIIKKTYCPNKELEVCDLNFATGGYDLFSKVVLRSGGRLNATEMVLSWITMLSVFNNA